MSEQTGVLANLENTLNMYFVEKAPFQLPDNVREIIVKIAPWLALIVFVITLPSFLILFGIGSYIATFALVYSTMFYISMVFLAIQLIILGISIPGLFGRKRSAWKLLFYSELVSIIAGIFTWLDHPAHIGSIIGTAISALIGLYLIFQVKTYYAN